MVDSDLYPTIMYRDPLLFPQFLRTTDYQSLQTQLNGDFLLSAYIGRLNSEIAEDIPAFADHRPFVIRLLNTLRLFGWAVVQNYETGIKVFGPLHKEDWLRVSNPETGKIERKGLKVRWIDDLGNTWQDTIYFEEGVEQVAGDQKASPLGYLFIWEEGDGNPLQYMLPDTQFAIPDVNLAVLNIAIQFRQIKGHMDFAANQPSFKHFVYGDSITAAQRRDLINQMAYVDLTNGIGAKESVLKEIRGIEDNAVEKMILALDEEVRFFAAETRLPLSYYLGEKQTGGLGDTGESTDEVKIAKKKQEILDHIMGPLGELWATEFGESLDDVTDFYTQQQEEEEAKADELLEASQDQQKPPVKGEP